MLTLNLHRAALQTIAITGCTPPVALTDAIFRLHEEFHSHPDWVFFDQESALALGSRVAYRRLNGDTIAVFGDDKDSLPAYIRVFNLDGKLANEWEYGNYDQAFSALHAWMTDIDPAPPLSSGDRRGSDNLSTRRKGLFSGGKHVFGE